MNKKYFVIVVDEEKYNSMKEGIDYIAVQNGYVHTEIVDIKVGDSTRESKGYLFGGGSARYVSDGDLF